MEKCGQNFGGLGRRPACGFGQHHVCNLYGVHEDEKCTCVCGKVMGEPLKLPADAFVCGRKA